MNYIFSWAGGDNPMRSISSNMSGFYYPGHLLQVSEELLEFLTLYRFFYDFKHAGQGQITPMG